MPRQQQFHVAPAMPALKYAILVNIKNIYIYMKLVFHVESHKSAVCLLKSGE